MKILASSNQVVKSEMLFCPLRKKWIAALPEELIRHSLIKEMTQNLGYPAELLAAEKNLREMPHITNPRHSLPKRRADLIVFAKNIHPQYSLYPLLLVECKAIPLTKKVLHQVLGYNHFVKAYFVAAVNQYSSYLYRIENHSVIFHDGLLPYVQLLNLVRASSVS